VINFDKIFISIIGALLKS